MTERREHHQRMCHAVCGGRVVSAQYNENGDDEVVIESPDGKRYVVQPSSPVGGASLIVREEQPSARAAVSSAKTQIVLRVDVSVVERAQALFEAGSPRDPGLRRSRSNVLRLALLLGLAQLEDKHKGSSKQ